MSVKGISSGVDLSTWVQSCNRIKLVLMTNGIEEGFNLKDHVAFRYSGFTRRVAMTRLMLMDALEQGRIVNVNSERAGVIQDWVVRAKKIQIS